MKYVPVGEHGLILDMSSVVEITPDGKANAVLIQATASDLRFTLDGSDPNTTDRGFDLVADALPYIIPYVHGRTKIRVIEQNPSGECNYQGIFVSEWD